MSRFGGNVHEPPVHPLARRFHGRIPVGGDGVASDSLFLAIDTATLAGLPAQGIVLDAGDAHTKLYALFSNRACAINDKHPTWRAAVAAAENDAALAALIFARTIVLSASKLDGARDRAILEALPSVD